MCDIMHFVLRICTNKFSFELFHLSGTFYWSVSIKLADHPYFTRSKGPADSFPGPNANTEMGDNNEQISLADVVVAQPTVAEQNDLIAQLMQQIADMRVEMQRRQDSPPLGFGTNILDARPPTYFPSSDLDPTQNNPSMPVHNPSRVDMTTQNP